MTEPSQTVKKQKEIQLRDLLTLLQLLQQHLCLSAQTQCQA
jgi:hypothetical protein